MTKRFAKFELQGRQISVKVNTFSFTFLNNSESEYQTESNIGYN